MKLLSTGVLGGLLLCGCAAPSPTTPAPATPAAAPATPSVPATPTAATLRYRCDDRTEFTVRFADDSATVDAGPRGSETLLRDAGGATPLQTVYSNPRVRAEFGLGSSGREAILRFAQAPQAVRCSRD